MCFPKFYVKLSKIFPNRDYLPCRTLLKNREIIESIESNFTKMAYTFLQIYRIASTYSRIHWNGESTTRRRILHVGRYIARSRGTQSGKHCWRALLPGSRIINITIGSGFRRIPLIYRFLLGCEIGNSAGSI